MQLPVSINATDQEAAGEAEDEAEATNNEDAPPIFYEMDSHSMASLLKDFNQSIRPASSIENPAPSVRLYEIHQVGGNLQGLRRSSQLNQMSEDPSEHPMYRPPRRPG